jgi:Ca2+-binding RTX toxin-like protein
MTLINGSKGADVLRGTRFNDGLLGLAGNDKLWGGGADDKLWGGKGDDRLFGEAGNDKLYGEAGKDWLEGGDGTDTLDGGDGNDMIYGGAGSDTIYGGGGADFIKGGDGADWIIVTHTTFDGTGSDGAVDIVYADNGHDSIAARDGSHDILYGEAGNDQFYISGDTVYAGQGNDYVDIIMYGGNGKNDVTLGSGQDRLEVWTGYAYHGQTTVRDFGADDRLDIVGEGFGTYGEPNAFSLFDRNGDHVIDVHDAGGERFKVSVVGDGLRLEVDGDSITLLHLSAIAADQML